MIQKFCSGFQILHMLMSTVEKQPLTTGGSPLQIRCKNFMTVKFIIPKERDCLDIYQSLLKLSQPGKMEPLADVQGRSTTFLVLCVTPGYGRALRIGLLPWVQALPYLLRLNEAVHPCIRMLWKLLDITLPLTLLSGLIFVNDFFVFDLDGYGMHFECKVVKVLPALVEMYWSTLDSSDPP